MGNIDISVLLAPVSAESPAGPDLEYDPLFIAIEDALRTEPEQQFGETIVEAEQSDWVQVQALSAEFLSRSKDLRAAVYLVQALVHGDGLSGLAQGLALIRALLEKYWDSIHPQLDPDDALDPTARVNILASLCDPAKVLQAVRVAPMVLIPGFGGITLRDLQIAKGELPAPPETDVVKLDYIEAAVHDADPSMLQDSACCVADAVRDIAAIEQLLVDQVGVTHAISLAELANILSEIHKFLQAHLDAPSELPSAPTAGDVSARDADRSDGAAGGRQPLTGEVACPADVANALDKIIDYYQVNEPSSPVPLLLQRAKRLVSLGFMDILRDIAPDALPQAENVTGADPARSDL